MPLSAIGYGRNPYGHPKGGVVFRQPGGGPYKVNAGYGRGDWAEEVTWKILPSSTRDEDGLGSTVPEPLRGFIEAVKPLLNELLAKWTIFPTLWDAQTVPLAQLPALAYNVGITVDPTKNEALQRSEVLNAPQLFIHKGTDLGYTILAAFEGLLVEIIPLWAENKEPGAALSPDGPTFYVPHFDEVSADDLPADATFADRFAVWPRGLYIEDDGVCRTARLRLVFSPPADPTQDFDPDVAGRIADRLIRFKPIYVEIDRITFDGLRGASQPWSQPINAGEFGIGMWSGPVDARTFAASQPWNQGITADTL